MQGPGIVLFGALQALIEFVDHIRGGDGKPAARSKGAPGNRADADIAEDEEGDMPMRGVKAMRQKEKFKWDDEDDDMDDEVGPVRGRGVKAMRQEAEVDDDSDGPVRGLAIV